MITLSNFLLLLSGILFGLIIGASVVELKLYLKKDERLSLQNELTKANNRHVDNQIRIAKVEAELEHLRVYNTTLLKDAQTLQDYLFKKLHT